jgi:hypothetical protein
MATFNQLINQLAVKDEQLSLLLLTDKLNRLSNAHPEDKTIGSMNRVIGQVEGDFISQANFKLLSQKMHTVGTKFAELFQEELGDKSAEPHITMAPVNQTNEIPTYQVQDQILVSALESVFDNHIPLKQYSKVAGDKALKTVSYSLDAWNLRPAQLTVDNGNETFIIIKADYETPKGLTSFYVPVEVSKNDVIEPDMFVGNLGPEDLNHATIKDYVKAQAGSKSKIGGNDLLRALTNASKDHREISATELAIIRLNASRQGQADFFNDQVLGLKVEASAIPDVSSPKTEEVFSFEKDMKTARGQASWKFGSTVDVGRNHIARELSSFGFKTHQIVITGHDESTIFYGIALDNGKTSFTVPVKIADQQIVKPVVLLCNGSLTSFDREGINSLVSENKSDAKIAAFASSFASLKPSEVLTNLRQAIAEENYVKAEDALNVLANSDDVKAHMTGFQIYMDALAGKKVVATQCSKTIKNGVSEYLLCSHTGLPVNKVYQDKQGFCRPMFRQGMAETYEGASFMNAKIFG